MNEQRLSGDRVELLANVAEMYYLDNKTQAEISKLIGVTRSMVSRMVDEAMRLGIVEISIRRPLQLNRELQLLLTKRLGLVDAYIVNAQPKDDQAHLLRRLGACGAYVLKSFLRPGIILGLPWGTTVSAVVDSTPQDNSIHPIVVQLVGAVGTHNFEYDGHGVVQRLAAKLGGEVYYLNAPFMVESEEIALSLIGNQSIQETFSMGKKCELALLGVGSVDLEYSSYYHAGYMSKNVLEYLQAEGVVGGVCGIHFDLEGKVRARDFQNKLISISTEDLRKIPNRVGVAGGIGKIRPILGAIRAGLINILATDSMTARELLAIS
jgi:deoxyribonucleoside regulator